MTPPGQARLLARAFFSRMFESDLMPAGLPQAQMVITVIAFFTGPAAVGPILLAKKYASVIDPDVIRAFAFQDRLLALMLAMLATAMVTLVIWENVFPDRRDSRTLGVLPIALRTFVVARLASIVALFALVFAASTALSALSFAVVGAMFRAPGGFLGILAAHFLATAGLQAFVFFGILGIQCAFISVAGPALAHRVAVIMQVVLVVLFLQVPLLLPDRSAFIVIDGAVPAWTRSSMLWWSPPIWFLALYEAIATGDYAETRTIAGIAAALACGVPLLALAFYAASYGRLTRLAIEGTPATAATKVRAGKGTLASIVRTLARTPSSRAVCAFTIRTLGRSRQHRMLLSVWLGVALALIVSALLPFFITSARVSLEAPARPILVIPLILIALTQTGMRMLFALPTEMKANWMFRVAEPRRLHSAVVGATAALTICGVMPGAAIAFVSATWLWGPLVGLMHACFCAALGTLLTQLLVRGLDKIPFTCTYAPGKAQVTRLWAAYLAAFGFFTYGMASIERAALRSPHAYAVIVGTLLALAVILAWLGKREASRGARLRFEEEPLDELTLVKL